MAGILKDPLLDIAGFLLWVMMALTAFFGSLFLFGILAAIFFYGQAIAQTGSATVFWTMELGLLLVAGILAMCFLFLRHMKRIVDSVGEGDPFIPENADRLTAMAWLMLAIQVVGIVLGPVAEYVVNAFGEGHTASEYDFGGGLVLILTLFILARVFRKGTEMREDLEGTV